MDKGENVRSKIMSGLQHLILIDGVEGILEGQEKKDKGENVKQLFRTC